MVGAFQIPAVLAVVLDEPAHVLEDLVVRVDGAEQVPLANAAAGGAAEVDLPLPAFDGHRAEVLHVGLRAVARTPGRGQLHLVRRLHALEAALDFLRQRNRIADAVAAEVGAHAALAGAEGFRVGVAARHPQVFPHARQVFLLDAQQVDPLAAGDLDHRHVVLDGHLGDAHELVGRRHAGVNARDHRERPVLLDVGVNAIVDEAGVALVGVLVGPQRFQQRRQADLAGGILLAAGQLLEYGADGLEAAVLDLGDELRFFERHARHVVVLGRVVAHFAEIRFQQLGHQPLARAAAQAGLGAGADLGDALAALGLNGLDDLPLADAVAIADLRVVGQVRRLEQRHAGGRSEEQVGPARGHLGSRP